MEIEYNISLKPYNTFGINVAAQYFTTITTHQHLQEALHWARQKQLPTLVLGGGSNVLFTQNYNGLVIKNNLKNIDIVREDDTHIFIKAAAGEVWHTFVQYCLQHNYAGVENLALIPGSVGASPLQNIGAYGVEIKDVFYELVAVHKETGDTRIFNNADCDFGYRESIFKHQYKDAFVITEVTYRLHKVPNFAIEYGAIRQQLEKNGVQEMSIQAIAQAVIAIRTSKLPDPKQIGNAGSFFKNPSVPKEQYIVLKKNFPSIVAYKNKDGSMKLAAGWLIEQCGWKGYRMGDAGVHDKQALVLVNDANATGSDLLTVCRKIQASVKEKFGVALHPEVNII